MGFVIEAVAFSSLIPLYPIPLVSQAAPPLIQTDLYFERQIGTTERVTEQQFQHFLQMVITPLFPDGLTVYDTQGHFLNPDGDLMREPIQVVSLVHEETPKNQQAIATIIQHYQQQFHQDVVVNIANQDVVIGFDPTADLIDNNQPPELIQVELYFGRNIGTTGRVSDRQFNQFLNDVVTPRFPEGLTVHDASGQFLDQSGRLIQELSKVISLVVEDTEQNETAIQQVITTYKQQFQQESVLEVVNEAVTIGLGQGEDLIDHDPTPELIQVDLYFGRNIGTTQRVSQRQFRQFLRDVVTSHFPTGLTVYPADGQFLDHLNRLIREPSNVVSLIMEDTPSNERSLNQIIDSYKQQFQQEAVLVVVDEDLDIAFGATATPSISTIRNFTLTTCIIYQSLACPNP